ncbi:hypothetical protein Ahy_B10g104282 [Arachis hypogaea]|uniref:Uncharacterized protein n=1 Tax=Arachis hypogaea TaxID=3818 RepID=A0A444X543_ARAHY|nr:hypothetical protein Ahy_B10g104282 [Arachis hypogaea]
MYIMTHFIVMDKLEKIRTINNRWSINFSHRTTVQPVAQPSYPFQAFCFKPIPELLAADKIDDSMVIDVIGEVVGTTVLGVFFGEMVDQILSYLEEGRVEPLRVIAQFFKPSRWNDKLKHADVLVKTIKEALSSTQEGPIWIAGTIVSINAGKDDWFYKSCRKCLKKLKLQLGIDMSVANVATLTEVHHLGVITNLNTVGAFDFFLLRRQADQIKDEECTDGKGHPPTLDHMMDMRLLFKVNVKAPNIRHYDQETDCSDSLDVFVAVVNLHNDTESMLSVRLSKHDGLEDNVTSLKSKIPAKRAPIGLKHKLTTNLDKEDVGFSTKNFSRKEGKRQKMQSHESYK